MATWFAAPEGTAAAGPALRAALGKGWRGETVRVCSGGECVRVVLSDWCLCRDRHGVPTIIDLSDDAFRRLAPLGDGVIDVRVEW